MQQLNRLLLPKLPLQVAHIPLVVVIPAAATTEVDPLVVVIPVVATQVAHTQVAVQVVLRPVASQEVYLAGQGSQPMDLMNFVYVGFWEATLIPVDVTV